MKVLVTGGAGYIGTSVVPLLLERGYDVTVFDCLMFGGTQILPFFRNPNFHFVKGDIRDKAALEAVVKGKNIIIHLAAIVGFPACRENPALAYSTNVEGTQNLADVITKDQYVLFGSTGSNYGSLVDAICTEDTPLNPLSIYGKTKTEAERILMATGQATAYRFATAFGLSPRLRLDLLVNDLTYQGLKQKYMVIYEADFMRTFIHVYDIARSFLFAIDNRSKMQGHVYNVGNESMNFSKRHICDLIASKTGAYVHYADVGEDQDKRNYTVSYEKIRNVGFETTLTIEDGVDELIQALEVVKVHNPHANA
ncbi:NAD(P)-dependent oxidoreductase [Candidatus Parcubacteria bacterium]|nr:NAD(P)-dependent oxidoreductase [Candidatus Parcubacteria bacterium]